MNLTNIFILVWLINNIMLIPLEKKLRKRSQIEVGYLQDEIIGILYNIDDNLILHGGTSIWRCYNGKRFSEDLDFYGIINITSLKRIISERALHIKKIKETENLIFIKISNEITEIRIEINKTMIPNKEIKSYETMNGSFFDIYTLSSKDLIMEKINAYLSRRYIRDLYDIYHLARSFNVDEETKERLRLFLRKCEKPVNENVLSSLIYQGITPSFKSMCQYLRSIV